MTNREKVIKGLEACSLAGTKDDCIGYGCPYLIYNDEVVDDCQEQMFDDALALLKAQEPRVLALEEIHRGMAVWLEDVDKADVILAIGGSSVGGAKCFISENDMSIAPKDAEYGIRWRAWNAEPSKEQREAVKFE